MLHVYTYEYQFYITEKTLLPLSKDKITKSGMFSGMFIYTK